MPQNSIDETELDRAGFLTALKLVWFSIRDFFSEKPGQIILSAIILLMLWGFHGNLELLNKAWNDYKGPGMELGTRPELIPGIPWDNELISFAGGFLLVVLIPILIITLGFKNRLSDFGLGWPPKDRRRLALYAFIILMAVSIPAFALATKDDGMRNLYPFYRPFDSLSQFAIYEICYLPFFISIEFIFRGYLLFGLAKINDNNLAEKRAGTLEKIYFGRYAIVISMLSYTAWHLGKPMPELFGTLFWGLAAGTYALAIRSIWPIIIAHWLLNVLLDGMNAGIINFF